MNERVREIAIANGFIPVSVVSHDPKTLEVNGRYETFAFPSNVRNMKSFMIVFHPVDNDRYFLDASGWIENSLLLADVNDGYGKLVDGKLEFKEWIGGLYLEIHGIKKRYDASTGRTVMDSTDADMSIMDEDGDVEQDYTDYGLASRIANLLDAMCVDEDVDGTFRSEPITRN